eukprot:655554_1
MPAVRGLEGFLRDRKLIKTENISALDGSTVGFESFLWLRLQKSFKAEPFQMAIGGQPLTLERSIDSEIKVLEQVKISPIFVFPELFRLEIQRIVHLCRPRALENSSKSGTRPGRHSKTDRTGPLSIYLGSSAVTFRRRCNAPFSTTCARAVSAQFALPTRPPPNWHFWSARGSCMACLVGWSCWCLVSKKLSSRSIMRPARSSGLRFPKFWRISEFLTNR